MPVGPRGERRPADFVNGATMVAKLSVGDITEKLEKPSGNTRSGIAGEKARAEKPTAERRTEVARKAAVVRWTP